MEPPADPSRALEAEPADAAGFLRRARQRQDRGDFTGAVADCAEALKREPDNLDAFLTRAAVRHDQGYLERALADLDRALQLRPADGRPYLLRGKIQAAEGKLDLARQDFDRALEIDPQSARAFTARAQVRAAQSDTAGAIADCNQALALDPGQADAYLARAAARWEDGDPAGALADCDEAIRRESDNARAYLLRGDIRQSEDDFDGADDDFATAVRLDPAVADTLRAQGYEPGPEEEHLPDLAGLPELGAGGPFPYPEDQGPSFGPPGRGGGLRAWIMPAGGWGAIMGAVYGALSDTFAAALALLLFTPLCLSLLFRGRVRYRQTVPGGLLLAAAVIVLFLFRDLGEARPLVTVTGGNVVNGLAWLLAWAVLGALVMVFAGAADLEQAVGYIRGGFGRAALRAQGGALAGLLFGALVGILYRLGLPGVLAGGAAGGIAGLVLAAAVGNGRSVVILVALGLALGAWVGADDPASVFRVLGAGVSAGLFWTVGGGLVGVMAGAAVGTRASDRVMKGPLFTRLFGEIPRLPEGRGLQMAGGLLGAVGGLFVGSCIGLVAGSVLGGLAAAGTVVGPVEDEGVAVWLGAAAVLGALLAVLFGSRLVRQDGILAALGETSRSAALTGPLLGLACAAGAAAGVGLAALAWFLQGELGGMLYWVCAGAGVGGTIGAKLWSVAEK